MDEEKAYVANGEQAVVEEVTRTYIIARLSNPDRRILIPRGNNGNGEEEQSETGCNWDLAYAISAHKAQGSSWKVVIVMLDSYPGAVRLCTREWLYTAISRAETLCVTMGRKAIADGMCRKSGIQSRKTFLRETIESLSLVRGERG